MRPSPPPPAYDPASASPAERQISPFISHPDFGLPYRQDRLIPIWIATLAVRQKNSVVKFQAAAELLEFFHLSKDGRHHRRIVGGLNRVDAAFPTES